MVWSVPQTVHSESFGFSVLDQPSYSDPSLPFGSVLSAVVFGLGFSGGPFASAARLELEAEVSAQDVGLGPGAGGFLVELAEVEEVQADFFRQRDEQAGLEAVGA